MSTRGGVVGTSYDLVGDTSYLVLDLVEGLTHEALDRVDGLRRVRDSLTLCRVTDLTLTTVDEGYDRGGRALTFTICDNDRLVTFEDCDTRVRRP